LLGVNELIALFRRQVAHAVDGPVNGLAAVGRQLLELLLKLKRLMFLIWSEVFPDFHAFEYAFLLLRGQAGKVLQPVLQACLLLRRQFSELCIVLEFAALLFRRQISIAAEPVASMARLVLRRMRFAGPSFIRTSGVRPNWVGASFFLKLALALLFTLLLLPLLRLSLLSLTLLCLPLLRLPLLLLTLLWARRLRMRLRRVRLGAPILGERWRKQQKGCETARKFPTSRHRFVRLTQPTYNK
jgi:hypothetical protein